MKYESDILQMIHKDATADFKSGFITEARMREYDEMCLPAEMLQNNATNDDTSHETANIKHAELVTA